MVEWVGSIVPVTEIVIAGGFDRFGKLHEFPKKHGHFPLILPGYNSDQLFDLQAWQHIPQAEILAIDLIVFCDDKQPKIGGIYVIPIGEDWFIVRLYSQDDYRRFFWIPLAYDENTKVNYTRHFEKQGTTTGSIAKELILASAIALKRILAI